MARPVSISRDKYFEALEIYQNPDIEDELIPLSTACKLTGISIAHLYKVCSEDQELKEAHTQARKSRSAYLRQQYDELVNALRIGAIDRDKYVDVQAANSALKAMAWALERDNRADYGVVIQNNVNNLQTPDLTGLSDELIAELKTKLLSQLPSGS